MHLLRILTGVLLFEAASGMAAWLLGGGPSAQSLIVVHTVAGICSIPYFRSYFVHIGYERDSRKFIRKSLGILSLLLTFVLAASGLALVWQAAAGPWISPWLHYTHLVAGIVLGTALLLHLVRSLDRLRLPDREAPTPDMPGGRFPAYLGAVGALCVISALVALALPAITYAGPGSADPPNAARVFLTEFLRRALTGGG